MPVTFSFQIKHFLIKLKEELVFAPFRAHVTLAFAQIMRKYSLMEEFKDSQIDMEVAVLIEGAGDLLIHIICIPILYFLFALEIK